ncbi:tRNA (guanosine(46)-N(7))-methyltransferase TrmB [Gulosibacter sp. 10]|uniref:tRNA (guanine(46)-N(7))-methyltransferase TrmB n=1 Tax=Gulosibacter sp. 10 TaxID=1255570 RepID=UPI00097E91CB|nr:tRNA (guanine-N7)-methyltransferase [Gulosibacter sp. 10]SJM70461.1 tRNA (guanine46-N7-)-methyltransferase [Gulosibacter sp. 10]
MTTSNEAGRSNAQARERFRIRSFSMRGHTRMARDYEENLERFGPKYIIDLPEGDATATVSSGAVVDLRAEFGREAPLVVEIGPGNGEQLAHAAKEHPDWDFLAFEAWHPGVAKCVGNFARNGLENVRVIEADVAQALPVVFGLEVREDERAVQGGVGVGVDGTGIATGRPDPAHPNAANPRARELWTFFPDPWRKARHRKRRLVSDVFTYTAAGVLEPGGVWRMATDWENYAWQMRDVVEDSAWFENPHRGERPDPADEQPERGGFAPRFEGRLLTHFEERGRLAGRPAHDVVGVRRNAPLATTR